MVSPLPDSPLRAPYYLGCPVWACREWSGTLFPEGTAPGEFLQRYSSVFNTVEGNSVFYGLPRRETVERWATESREGFRFAFKFPRVITHELGLGRARRETATFLDLMAPLAEHGRLGPMFLQMPPLFGPTYLEDLRGFLERLPTSFRYALEVRHRDWFDGEDRPGSHESRLNNLLRGLGIDRVHFDSRPLFHAPAEDPVEAESQRRKPRLPYRTTVTGRHPMVRLVGRNTVDQVQPWLSRWADTFADWLGEGREPFIFLHAPSDRHAPELARRFHRELSRRVPGLPPLPDWPGERVRRERPVQTTLFE